jgi:hypothetical protein
MSPVTAIELWVVYLRPGALVRRTSGCHWADRLKVCKVNKVSKVRNVRRNVFDNIVNPPLN